jgi:hypothetical protein
MWQCVQQAELTILNHRVLVANSRIRIAVHTDKLAPQGFHSAFKLLPVLVDDVPIHDRSPLNITVYVSRCGHLDRALCETFEISGPCAEFVVMQLRICGSQLS